MAQMTHCPLWFSLHCCGGPLGIDALAHEWPKDTLVCIPANTVAPGLPRESSERRDDSSPGGPQMAQENLVCKPLPAAARSALGDHAAHGSPQSGERQSLAPRTGQTPTVGLTPEQDPLSTLELLDTVVSTLQNARASSTGALHAYKWKYFQNWCMTRGCSVVTPSKEGRSPQMVLEALTNAPFEPIHSIGLKDLSMKTAFLLVISSTKSELQALSTLTTELHYYYIVELSFYWSLMFSQFTDIKRKDFLIMFLHHLVTISLITFSYVNNMVRVGTLVMCLHDASDVVLEVSNDDRSDIESSSNEEDAPSPTKKTHNTATNGTNGANGTNGYLTGTTCPDEH
ncbi:UNVERIFIED_CONTAM: hypothetical protein FKN15_067613 [Acipenser sinensis]